MDDKRADSQRVRERAFPTAGESTCKRTSRAEPTAGTNLTGQEVQNKVQKEKEQDKVKYKMNASMRVIHARHESCGQHERQEPYHPMKGNRGRLVRILATESDIMCGCSEQQGKLVLRNKVMSVVVISRRKPRN